MRGNFCVYLYIHSFIYGFQACTEMMLPSDTNNDTDMFPPNTFDPSQHCMDKFGVKYRKDWMKTQFWGKGTSRLLPEEVGQGFNAVMHAKMWGMQLKVLASFWQVTSNICPRTL